jgi:uncharacterized membrane protein YhaH (DUF805 family)
MSFGQAVSSVLRQYATFTGRARRSEFWFFYLFYLLVYGGLYTVGLVLVLAGADRVTGEPSGPSAVLGGIVVVAAFLFALAVLVPTLAVTVRRLHDTGRSGFWYFISFVPLVGPIVLLVFLAQDSEPAPNAHGANPKDPLSLRSGHGVLSQFGPVQQFGPLPPARPAPGLQPGPGQFGHPGHYGG